MIGHQAISVDWITLFVFKVLQDLDTVKPEIYIVKNIASRFRDNSGFKHRSRDFIASFIKAYRFSLWESIHQ